MICPKCGVSVQDWRQYCNNCGEFMQAPQYPGYPPTSSGYGAPPPYGTPPPPYGTAPPPYGAPPPPYGAPPPPYGAPPPPYGAPPYGYTPAQPRSEKAKTGGWLLMIAGGLGLMNGLFTMLISSQDTIMGYADEGMVLCSALTVVFSIIAIAGGLVAVKRMAWPFALVGGICAILSLGPCFLASILGLIGLIMIAMAKDEFV